MAVCFTASLASRDPWQAGRARVRGYVPVKKQTVLDGGVKCKESAIPRERSTRAKRLSRRDLGEKRVSAQERCPART